MDACSSNFLLQDGIGKFDGFHAEILKETIQWDGHIINNARVIGHRQPGLQIHGSSKSGGRLVFNNSVVEDVMGPGVVVQVLVPSQGPDYRHAGGPPSDRGKMPPLQLSVFFMNHDGRGLTRSSVFFASLIVWVTSGVALTACNGRSDAVDAPVVAGVDSPDKDLAQFLNGMIQDARSLPASGLMRGRLAMAYENNLFPDEALISYAQAAVLDPEDFRWPYFSAQLKGRQGRHQAALDDLERAMEIDADYAPAWLWRGTWLLDLDRPGEAMTAFERAHALGADKEASFGRARVLIAQEEHADAVTLLEPLARDYRHPYIYRTLGFALRALGRMEEARTAVALGRAADPLSWRDPRAAEKAAFVRGIGRFSFAQNLLGAGKVDDALEILETLRGEQPDETCGAAGHHAMRTCEILNTLTLAYVRAGREDEAFALVRRGLSINPDFFPFHLNIADRYRHRRELDSALRHIERVIALNPSLGYGYEQRGRLLIGLGRYDEAMTALETAVRLAPERPATLLYLGMVEGELERWPQAVEHLRRAIRLDPGFAVGHAYLARSLGETGRIDEAWQAFRMAEQNRAPAYELEATERRLKERSPRSDASELPGPCGRYRGGSPDVGSVELTRGRRQLFLSSMWRTNEVSALRTGELSGFIGARFGGRSGNECARRVCYRRGGRCCSRRFARFRRRRGGCDLGWIPALSCTADCRMVPSLI